MSQFCKRHTVIGQTGRLDVVRAVDRPVQFHQSDVVQVAPAMVLLMFPQVLDAALLGIGTRLRELGGTDHQLPVF